MIVNSCCMALLCSPLLAVLVVAPSCRCHPRPCSSTAVVHLQRHTSPPNKCDGDVVITWYSLRDDVGRLASCQRHTRSQVYAQSEGRPYCWMSATVPGIAGEFRHVLNSLAS